eukprot:CAMPEP_0202840868 /NCGR_PEP_ID=MMETSP1389-20130828/56997_1 /ASSEMBLY_ACC=CAM_ASM_000865 /TAXON_ID=302021 /ORGANISM="Rhodomonas sp., Strain CCMP768" /LENGTH=137 /DNA_ID=CAMNT_0049517601 /DNA_START=751 /DNA_END=1160 /DNA_ORIENTATION=+
MTTGTSDVTVTRGSAHRLWDDFVTSVVTDRHVAPGSRVPLHLAEVAVTPPRRRRRAHYLGPGLDPVHYAASSLRRVALPLLLQPPPMLPCHFDAEAHVRHHVAPDKDLPVPPTPNWCVDVVQVGCRRGGWGKASLSR